jgi:LPS O-antigen subunit length determinant protein (WzzB/FepE family)
MPDLLLVLSKRWKMILSVTILATILALIFSLLSPKKYLSVATALPVNSVTADKSRIFNSNIEALYSDFGLPDELDRIEGTAQLDTIFIAASEQFDLNNYYSIKDAGEGTYKAAIRLKKNTKIYRSAYGELKIKTWDRDRKMSAEMANFLMQKLQELHQHLQNQSNVLALGKMKDQYTLKQKEYLQLTDSLNSPTNAGLSSSTHEIIKSKLLAITPQLQQFERMITEYEFVVNSNSPVLLIVENARPALWPDKPKVLLTVLLTFFAALLFSYLIALFIENRNFSVD